MSTDLTQPGLERPATRADLARQLLARVEQMQALLGTVPLATEVQLLKRDLSRGHDVLRASPGEASFLSVVTLVESALACLTWKQYTHEVVDVLRQTFAAGTRQAPFTFADYDAVRQLFAERRIPTVPAVDLEALGPEDLEDGPEG
jgi:hypothetical protein